MFLRRTVICGTTFSEQLTGKSEFSVSNVAIMSTPARSNRAFCRQEQETLFIRVSNNHETRISMAGCSARSHSGCHRRQPADWHKPRFVRCQRTLQFLVPDTIDTDIFCAIPGVDGFKRSGNVRQHEVTAR
jgi:hypothetical protein